MNKKNKAQGAVAWGSYSDNYVSATANGHTILASRSAARLAVSLSKHKDKNKSQDLATVRAS